MPLFLKPDTRLVPDPGGPWLERAGVPVRHRLAVQEALALGALGVTGDAAASASFLSECFDADTGARWIARVLDRWATYLGDGAPRPLDLDLLRALDPRRSATLAPLRRDAAPAAITWLVTLGCNRRCPYCFYRVTPWAAGQSESPPDATFPLEDARRMVDEMGRIGAADLYLTGGEPLLRRDLPDIVAGAAAAGVRVHVNTKYAVDDALARKLAAAGVHEVTVSLDDARPRIANALAGAPGYLGEASGAIRALLRAGVRLRVNAVATRLNLPHLDALVEAAIRMRVPKLVVSPYSEPYPRRPAAARLTPEPVSLHAIVADLARRFGDRIALEVGPAEVPDAEGGPCGDQMLCEVGLRTLDLLPDGQVTRCRYMPDEPALVVGDLRRETLLEVWNGPRLRGLYAPPAETYAGTACGGCGAFGSCHARGRCFMTAKATHGRLHAPDAWCTAGHAQ